MLKIIKQKQLEIKFDKESNFNFKIVLLNSW